MKNRNKAVCAGGLPSPYQDYIYMYFVKYFLPNNIISLLFLFYTDTVYDHVFLKINIPGS